MYDTLAGFSSSNSGPFSGKLRTSCCRGDSVLRTSKLPYRVGKHTICLIANKPAAQVIGGGSTVSSPFSFSSHLLYSCSPPSRVDLLAGVSRMRLLDLS